jgi:hypothetical protein
VDHVEPEWLPWIAQFLGDSGAVSSTSDVTAQRNLVKAPVNFNRGKPSGIISAAQATLTGAKSVLVLQRTSGNPWTISVFTYDTETPDTVATANAILANIPAWLISTVSVVAFGSYATLAASHATYTLMEAAHATYSDIPVHPAA